MNDADKSKAQLRSERSELRQSAHRRSPGPPAEAAPTQKPQARPSLLSYRALLVGLFLGVAIGLIGPYFTLFMRGSNTGGGFYTNPMSHFFLFVLVGLINVLVGRLRRPWAFSRGELVTVYILMTLGNQSLSMSHYWTPMLCGPYYFASETNDWARILHPYLPQWIMPYRLEGLRAFFEGTYGQTAGEGLWKVWIEPALAWTPMLIAIHAGTLCMMVIVRRQWSERERIIYPLIQVAGDMVRDDERQSLIKPFFRNPVMWIGFALPFLVGVVQGLNAYFPYIPEPQLRASLSLPGQTSMPIIMSFVATGFFFLIKLEVGFSLWMFALFNLVQKGIYNTIGVADKPEPALSLWSYDLPSLVHQSVGAMTVLVIGGLWVGREHLINVFRKAFAGDGNVEDRDEVLSYRGATVGLILCGAVMAVWMNLSGVPILGVAAFLFFVFIIFVALTRVVVEGGVAMLYTPLVPPDAALSAFGTGFYGPTGILGLTFARVWANDIFNFAMPHCANGLKLGEQIRGNRRPLFWFMLAAMILGLYAASFTTLFMGYRYGAVNLSDRHFVWLAQYIYEYAAARIVEPVGPNWAGWLHTGLGGLAMGLLMVAQRVWLWWPLHPIGYPISSVFSWMAFNAFLAWLVKSIVLKYGGPRLFRKVRPFFLGLIIGQFAIYGVFWIVDLFTGMVGNYLMQ